MKMGIVYQKMTLTLMNQMSRAVLMDVQWGVTTQHSWAVALTPSRQGQGSEFSKDSYCFFFLLLSYCLSKALITEKGTQRVRRNLDK